VGVGEARAAVVTLMKSEVGSALYDRGRVNFVFVDSAVALKEARPPDLRRQELFSTYFLAFNTQRPPLDRVETRRAIGVALDRAALLRGLLPEARPTCELLPPGLPGATERAQRACGPMGSRPVTLEGGGQRPLRLVYRAGESFIPEVAIAERIKSQLARLGVQIELEARYDFSAEIARIAADGFPAADLYLRRIGADYAHPKTFFTFFERGGNHYTGWEKLAGGEIIRRFETVLQRADALPESSAAAELYARAQEILLEEAVVIAPIYHPDRYFRVRPSLLGLDVDPFNFLSLRELRLARP
jgi:peptide/nickel transport system substrate-binding protein